MCDNYGAVTLLCSLIHSLVFSLRGQVGRNQSPVMYNIQNSGKYFICKIKTICWGNNRRIRWRLMKGNINCWSNFYCETNIGKILGTEYRSTSTIYWFSSSLWHCVEDGNMESNAYIKFSKKLVKLWRILNTEIYAKIKICLLNLKLTKFEGRSCNCSCAVWCSIGNCN